MNSLTPDELDALIERDLQADYDRYGLEGFELRWGRYVHIGIHKEGQSKERCPGCERERLRKNA